MIPRPVKNSKSLPSSVDVQNPFLFLLLPPLVCAPRRQLTPTWTPRFVNSQMSAVTFDQVLTPAIFTSNSNKEIPTAELWSTLYFASKFASTSFMTRHRRATVGKPLLRCFVFSSGALYCKSACAPGTTGWTWDRFENCLNFVIITYDLWSITVNTDIIYECKKCGGKSNEGNWQFADDLLLNCQLSLVYDPSMKQRALYRLKG